MKVIEVINFLHELDLLEAHLDEHQHFMDKIVIIESELTYSGMPKPLIFADNKSRFSRFNIEHVVFPKENFIQIPASYPREEEKRWFNARRQNREIQQDFIFKTFKTGYDYIANSDADEIWSRNCWGYVEDCMKQDFCYIVPIVRRFWHFVDAIAKKQDFYRITKTTMDTHCRQKGTKRGRTATTVGWHFSACYKNPKDLWYKGVGLAQSTGYLGWTKVPSPDECQNILNSGNLPFMNVKIDPGYGVMPKEDLSWLPSFMAKHPDLYPWLDEKYRENKPISNWKLIPYGDTTSEG